MGLSQKTVLRAGYGSVIALLLFSSVEVYRIQNTVSEKHVEIDRRYVQQDAAVSQLRRTIWLAGNYVRDFFIKTSPAGADLLKKQLQDLEQQSLQAMDQIDKLRTNRQTQSALDAQLQEFWKVVHPISDSMLNSTDVEQYAFVQQEIVPRRSSVSSVLRELTAAEQQALEQSEAEFGEARRSAARRLVLMLASTVVLALGVSHLSLRPWNGRRSFSTRKLSARGKNRNSFRLVCWRSKKTAKRSFHANCTMRLARPWPFCRLKSPTLWLLLTSRQAL